MKKTNIDSPFYRTMGKIGDLLFANLLWLVCCLPIVTAGASTLGLFTVVNKMAAKPASKSTSHRAVDCLKSRLNALKKSVWTV